MEALDSFEKTKVQNVLNQVTPEFLKDVEDLFYLGEKEVKIYLALLLQDGLTAREIYQVTGIPRTRVYGYLTNLVKKGFIEERKSKVTTYFSRDPLLVQARYEEEFKEELRVKVLKLHHVMYEFLEVWKRSRSLKGKDAHTISIETSFPELFRSIGVCTTRLWIAIVGKGGLYHWPETTGLLVDAMKRGVEIKYYTNKPYVKQVLHSRISQASVYTGVKVYYSMKIPHNFILVDNNLFLLLEKRGETQEELVIQRIEQPEIVKAYEQLALSMEDEEL